MGRAVIGDKDQGTALNEEEKEAVQWILMPGGQFPLPYGYPPIKQERRSDSD
jgi:hypothetical protein